MALSVINFTNEKGNVSAKVRGMVSAQVMGQIMTALGANPNLAEVVHNVNGGLSIPVAKDHRTGETIYAHLAMTISTADPTVKVERKKKTTKVVEETPIVNLFD